MGLESVYTSLTTLRSTTAEDGKYEFIPSLLKSKADTIAKNFLPQQISRPYRPLLPFNLSLGLESDEEKKSGAQLLRLHNKPDTPPSALFPQNNNLKGEVRARAAGVALADVWDG